jgi:carboxypeptidase family protein
VVGTPLSAKTDAAGSFAITRVGPGPISIRVEATGYKAGDEAAVIPPEARATVQIKLQKEGVKALATLRGIVRSKSGHAVPASLRVVEADVKARASLNGHFALRVPGGHYTVVIEAPGYISQTKVVDVADGDEAIFNIDLHPAAR